MQRPAVSVVVPVYNRRDVVARAVGSLLSQDFGRPCEVVVVDDGSTDGSGDVAARLDRRVRVVRLDRNRGAAASRHAGIGQARADVVAFLDSDNVAEPSHLSALWEGLHRRPEVVLSFARIADIAGRPLADERLPSDLTADRVLTDPLRGLLEVGCFVGAMNLMTYRELALAASQGREHVVAANDYDVILRLALRGPFAFVRLARARRGRLCCKVASVGLRRARWGHSLRRFWWALNAPSVKRA